MPSWYALVVCCAPGLDFVGQDQAEGVSVEDWTLIWGGYVDIDYIAKGAFFSETCDGSGFVVLVKLGCFFLLFVTITLFIDKLLVAGSCFLSKLPSNLVLSC